MSELAPPLCDAARGLRRMVVIEQRAAQIARLEHEQRMDIAALAEQDTEPLLRSYIGDSVAVSLAQSPGTGQHLVDTARMYAEHPALHARVGLPLIDGGWTIKHVDAVLNGLAWIGLDSEQQARVVALVTSNPSARTPYQLRKATEAAVMILDPQAAARRFDKAKRNRNVRSDAWASGQATFSATGTASQIAAVMASLDALAGPKQPGDVRTLDQRRYDAFLDLLCGRIAPGQWQALIIVPLSILNGDDSTPAEIPGLGLVSAAEARDVLAHAELRRAVVTDDGTLISVDGNTHPPDLAVPVPADPPHPDTRLSLDPEPDDPEPDFEQAPEDAGDELVTELVTELLSTLEAELTALLEAAALAPSTSTPRHERVHHVPALSRLTLEIDTTHRPDQGGGGGSPGGGGGGDPEPEPPSLADLLWHDDTLERGRQDAHLPKPRFTAEPDVPEQPTRDRPPSSSWTLPALTRAHRRLLTQPVDQRPLESSAYALPSRLARHIKTRDLTCTFPGCTRLARDCQSDHLNPWPAGPTTAHNTASECVHHHQAKHACFTVTRTPDGTLHWTTPHGRTIPRPVRPLLRGW